VRSLSSLFTVRRHRRREQLGEVRVSKGVSEHHSVVTIVLQHALDEVEELPVIARVGHHIPLQTNKMSNFVTSILLGHIYEQLLTAAEYYVFTLDCCNLQITTFQFNSRFSNKILFEELSFILQYIRRVPDKKGPLYFSS